VVMTRREERSRRLCPAEIAAAANISMRYLHKLFAAEHQPVAGPVAAVHRVCAAVCELFALVQAFAGMRHAC